MRILFCEQRCCRGSSWLVHVSQCPLNNFDLYHPAHLKHNVKKIIIFDIDLHHGKIKHLLRCSCIRISFQEMARSL